MSLGHKTVWGGALSGVQRRVGLPGQQSGECLLKLKTVNTAQKLIDRPVILGLCIAIYIAIENLHLCSTKTKFRAMFTDCFECQHAHLVGKRGPVCRNLPIHPPSLATRDDRHSSSLPERCESVCGFRSAAIRRYGLGGRRAVTGSQNFTLGLGVV